MISVEEVKKIAGLAKFSLDIENLEELAADMNKQIVFTDSISNVDVDAMDLTAIDEQVPLREDVVVPSMPIEKIMQNAKESHDGYFVARG